MEYRGPSLRRATHVELGSASRHPWKPSGLFPCGKRCGWRVAIRVSVDKKSGLTGEAAIAYLGMLRHCLRQLVVGVVDVDKDRKSRGECEVRAAKIPLRLY